eukprot:Gb_09886 [translate_table: standard]
MWEGLHWRVKAHLLHITKIGV